MQMVARLEGRNQTEVTDCHQAVLWDFDTMLKHCWSFQVFLYSFAFYSELIICDLVRDVEPWFCLRAIVSMVFVFLSLLMDVGAPHPLEMERLLCLGALFQDVGGEPLLENSFSEVQGAIIFHLLCN